FLPLSVRDSGSCRRAPCQRWSTACARGSCGTTRPVFRLLDQVKPRLRVVPPDAAPRHVRTAHTCPDVPCCNGMRAEKPRGRALLTSSHSRRLRPQGSVRERG